MFIENNLVLSYPSIHHDIVTICVMIIGLSIYNFHRICIANLNDNVYDNDM